MSLSRCPASEASRAIDRAESSVMPMKRARQLLRKSQSLTLPLSRVPTTCRRSTCHQSLEGQPKHQEKEQQED